MTEEWSRWMGPEERPMIGEWVHIVFADRAEYIGRSERGPIKRGDPGFRPSSVHYFGPRFRDPWGHRGKGNNIPVIRWRRRIPRALIDLREMLELIDRSERA